MNYRRWCAGFVLANVAISCTDPGPAPDPSWPLGPITGPRELHDIDAIKRLTLADANVVERGRTHEKGVTLVQLAWVAFEHPFVTASGATEHVPWRQRGVLCLPDSPRAGLHQAVLYNLHDNGGTDLYHAWCVDIAAGFGVPVFIHGWEPDVVAAIDGLSYHATQFNLMQRLLAAEIEDAAAFPLDGRYLLGTNVLAKGDMVAISVLQRVVERDLGTTVDEVGSLGISKEGQAHWVLAAVDDRVAVAAPGGAFTEDIGDFVASYRDDWGCQLLGAAPPEFIEVWKLYDWVLHTPAGQLADLATSPARWTDQLRPRHLLISGDLGIPSLGQHDAPWPIHAEDRFLDELTTPFQYVRAWGGSGVHLEKTPDDNARSLLPQVADILIDGTLTPTTPVVTATATGRQLTLTATSQLSPTATAVEAKLLYALTADRSVRQRDVSWVELAMQPVAARGTFTATLPVVPAGQQLTYVVAIREQVDRGPLTYWRGASRWPVTAFELPASPCTMPTWR